MAYAYKKRNDVKQTDLQTICVEEIRHSERELYSKYYLEKRTTCHSSDVVLIM